MLFRKLWWLSSWDGFRSSYPQRGHPLYSYPPKTDPFFKVEGLRDGDSFENETFSEQHKVQEVHFEYLKVMGWWSYVDELLGELQFSREKPTISHSWTTYFLKESSIQINSAIIVIVNFVYSILRQFDHGKNISFYCISVDFIKSISIMAWMISTIPGAWQCHAHETESQRSHSAIRKWYGRQEQLEELSRCCINGIFFVYLLGCPPSQ